MPPSTSKINVHAALIDNPAHLRDLGLDLRDVGLPAIARVDSHQQGTMAMSSRKGRMGVDGRLRLYPNSRPCARLANGGKRSGQIRARLRMDDDDVRAGLGDVCNLACRLMHHHMNVQRDAACDRA